MPFGSLSQDGPGTEPTSACSDPLIIPPKNAPSEVHQLWSLHGGPFAKRYSDPKLTSLTALVKHNAVTYKDQTAFVYPISDQATTAYKAMTWDEFDSITADIALEYGLQLQEELKQANMAREQPTIALLGRGITIEYFCTQLALQALGIKVLLLAESNPPNALHHLLETCSVLAVITDERNANTDTNGVQKLKMLDSSVNTAIDSYAKIEELRFRGDGDPWDHHTFIIHTSGSTGMPKPVIHTNRSAMLVARMFRLFPDFIIENWYLLFPLYHIAGIFIALSNLPNGQILSFPPLSWPPSSSSIFTSWKTLSRMGFPVECVHCAPALIENMYEYIIDNGGDFTPLSTLKIVQPGGAALADNVLKALVANRVNVKTTYGSTEIGPVMRTIPHTADNPKCYSFRVLDPDNPFIKMEEVGTGIYECVLYKGFDAAAELWDGKPDDEPYRTNDIFIQDPPDSGFFVLQGRRDDILVHTNGENTSAGALQLDIQSSSKVINKVLALGHSRPYVALLVEANVEYDPAEKNIQESIWDIVEQVNTRYPSHSRIMKSMIYILPKGAALPVTPKGNVKRKEVERVYAEVIEQLYYIAPPEPSTRSSNQESLRDFLRSTVAIISAMPESSIDDWTSFYDLGIDSRHALQIRNSLTTFLGHSISINAIFENPSISKLLAYLNKGQSSDVSGNTIDKSATINQMISSLESEIRHWPAQSKSSYPAVEKETVLLTGATGYLGAALLESLSKSPKIGKIYALVRGRDHASKLYDSLTSKGIDASILNTNSKFQVLNFSMQDPLLGLDIETYYELAKTVTVVIQNAWKMDFNIGVEGFMDDCIRSTMHLLRLCRAGRTKHMVFTSSVSASMGSGQISKSISESPISSDPSVAMDTGYAQSKYIIERLLQSPHLHSIPKTILRLGQLCGSSINGIWNTSDMYPILFSTSSHPSMRALPLFPHESIDWIPFDIAARACVELVFPLLPEPPSNMNSDIGMNLRVFNIVNPHPITWDELARYLNGGLQVQGLQELEEVEMKEWVRRLEGVVEGVMGEGDGKEIQGVRLLGFFQDMAEEEEGGERRVFETEMSVKGSETLRECGAVSEEWVGLWIESWREMGFL